MIIAGDFNHRKIAEELRNYPDIKQVLTPPTRGNNCLDIVLTNFAQNIERSGIMDPIFNEIGQASDHKTVYVKANIPRIQEYSVKSYTYLRQTPEGDKIMAEKLAAVDWSGLEDGG